MIFFQNSVQVTLKKFINSEESGAILILLCALISLAVANSSVGESYQHIWHKKIFGLSLDLWINDGLMAIFFLFIGLELERELYSGELSNFRKALLPIFAAVGGIALPALIHFSLNVGTPTKVGIGIPMATDIAFALGVLAVLGSRVPASLRVFLTALAVMDDLGAIIVIALFYTADLHTFYLVVAIVIFIVMVVMNRALRIIALLPYLMGGAVMWFFMLKSGIHATIAGVLLAFAVPYSSKKNDEESPSHKLEQILHKPVLFLILPIFAMANTGLSISSNWAEELSSRNSIGILAGLVIGKPLGISLLVFIVVHLGICRLPIDLNWKHIFGAGLLGGIGFTMSIFITNLAFAGDAEIINASKFAILLASLAAGLIGFVWLNFLGRGNNRPTKNFDPTP